MCWAITRYINEHPWPKPGQPPLPPLAPKPSRWLRAIEIILEIIIGTIAITTYVIAELIYIAAMAFIFWNLFL